MAGGRTFVVPHPEMILVGQTSVRIYTVQEGDPNEKGYDTSLLLMLLETIEPLDAPVHQTKD